jgi:hypothetical protein
MLQHPIVVYSLFRLRLLKQEGVITNYFSYFLKPVCTTILNLLSRIQATGKMEMACILNHGPKLFVSSNHRHIGQADTEMLDMIN